MAIETDLITNTTTTIGGAIFKKLLAGGAGTGQYNTFLAISSNTGKESGFNSDDTNPLNSTNTDIDVAKTHTVLLGNVPIIVVNGIAYYEFRVDLNESNNTPNSQISLDTFKVFTSGSSSIESTAVLFTQNLVYDMDALATGGDRTLLLSDASSSGSGTDDYSVLVPVANFAGQDPATTYLYLYVQMGFKGGDYGVNGTFEEWNLADAGTLQGYKFNDLNSDGIWDKDGADNVLGNTDDEKGVAGVTVFLDTDKDGVLDADERSAVTDANGKYTFFGAAVGTYQIDEVVPAGSAQTTGLFETATVATVGQLVTVDPIGNHYPVPHVAISKTFINVTDGPDGGNTTGSTTVLDGAGDIANYTINVLNNGETALTGVTVTDTLANAGAVAVLKAGGFNSGDTDSDGVLDVGETWHYTATQTATQADLDTNGGTGDGDKDNSATVVATQQGTTNTVTATATAAAPIVPSASLAITKVFTGYTGGDLDNLGDVPGDVANYTIVVTNTGNVTLTNVVVTDPLTGNTYNVGTLAPGGSSSLTELYTVTQADLDGGGKAGPDHDIDNTATAVSDQTGPASASAVAPLVYAPSIAIDKTFVSWADGGANGNAAGDVANYTVKITNTGNVTLTNVTVVDPLTGQSISGVTLAPGATQTYNTSYTLTQADLDNNGGGDGDIDNTATTDSDQTGPASDSAVAPIAPAPAVTIDKTFTGFTGGNGNTVGDAVGDVLNYSILVTNTGNVTLTNVVVTDPLTGLNTTIASLAPGASQTLTETYTLTQADLDGAGKAGSDHDIDNTATADPDQTPPVSDTVEVPLVYAPGVDLEKLVSKTGGSNLANYIDADTAAAGYQNVGVQQDMFFAITAQNTGNVTLTDVVITDVSTAYGGSTKILFTGGSLTADALALGATLSGDTDSDGKLDVGETWTILYKQGYEFGQHVNTATITDTQNATDTDLAYYYGIVTGPGVRTPGFWSNLGGQFWDNIVGNETKSGPTFAKGELLYAVDSNNDGVIDGNDKVGLLIGDFNHNGRTDAGEDTLFIGLSDAKNLINSSLKTQSADGVQKLGRDVVATWLNFLAENPIGDAADTASPKHFVQDAVNWLQTWGGTAGNGAASNLADNVKTETFDTYFAAHTAVKTNTPQWNVSQFAGDNHSGAQIHSALDYYNNTGQTSPTSDHYAMSADSSADVTLIMASQVIA